MILANLQDLRNQPRIFVIATVEKQSQSLDFRSKCVSHSIVSVVLSCLYLIFN